MNTNDPNGYFGPDSITWQIYREPIFLLGSVRALLLQVAHPAVADGVARFSNFESDAFGRGKRTFEAMTLLYFGDCRQAEFAARGMSHMHRHIQGSYAKVIDGKTLSIPYHADEPALKLWILATLIDTTLLVYETVSGPMSIEKKTGFYEESKQAAKLLGIPPEVYPVDYHAFKAWFENMLNGNELYIGETGRKIAKSILEHKYAPDKITRVLATAFLPEHLLEAFEIPRHTADQQNLKKLLNLTRIGFKCIPARLRWVPAYHQACRRVALASHQQPKILGQFYGWLGNRINLPFGIPRR